jgi:hypothetical protein
MSPYSRPMTQRVWRSPMRRLIEAKVLAGCVIYLDNGPNNACTRTISRLADRQEQVLSGERRATELAEEMVALRRQQVTQEELIRTADLLDGPWQTMSRSDQARILRHLLQALTARPARSPSPSTPPVSKPWRKNWPTGRSTHDEILDNPGVFLRPGPDAPKETAWARVAAPRPPRPAIPDVGQQFINL